MEANLLSQVNRSELTVNQLKDELRSRGAKLTGNKSELEDRLRFILTTGKVIPTQTGKKTDRILPNPNPSNVSPKVSIPKGVLPKISLPPPVLSFPPVPKYSPKRVLPKIPVNINIPVNIPKILPNLPAVPLNLSVQEAGPSPTLQKLIDLKYHVIKESLTVDQLKRELSALGISTAGNKAQLNATLSNYLNAISLSEDTINPPIQFSRSTGSPQAIFDLYNSKTTETLLQNAEPGMYVSFFDPPKNSYHTFYIQEVQRSPFGLVSEMILDPRGYSLIRSSNQWKLFYNAQANSNTSYFLPIALGLQLIP